MDKLINFKRPFVWLKRLRHRCGYGVHSPFAFNFITNIIYEKTNYYAYSTLERLAKEKNKGYSSKKNNRLVFRIVNWAQPNTIVEFGPLSITSDYIKAAKSGFDYFHLPEYVIDGNKIGDTIDLLYIHYNKETEAIEKVLSSCIEQTNSKSVFIIEGIRYSGKMKKLWNEITKNDKCTVTFDLYSLGIIFFDKTKIKQHYIINF